MAPSRNRKQPARQADYSNIGVAGRKTGITLQDKGIRDEHGLEPIDGIFSSPEKPSSTPRSNGNNHTIVEEEDMSIGNSTVPEPTEVLSSRRVTLPPRSRSPIKTHLNSSPRKSIGALSSPSRPSDASANGAASAFVDDGLDTAIPTSSPIAASKPKAYSSRTAASVSKPTARSPPMARRKRKRVFDISNTESEDDHSDSARNEAPTALPDDLGLLRSSSSQSGENAPDVRQQRDASSQPDADTTDTLMAPNTATSSGARRRPGRPKVGGDAESILPSDQNSTAVSRPKGRRGRPPKKCDATERVETGKQGDTNDIEIDEGESQKKMKLDPKPQASQPPPSRRNPKARVTGGHAKDQEDKAAADRPAVDRGKPKSRGLLLLRSETPADDSGAQVLRSGRTSVKPMAFWRNERIVYDKSNVDGLRLPLQGIKEVIRTEELPPPEKRARRRGRRHRPIPEAEEDDEDQDPWEVDEGIYGGQVMKWDNETQKSYDFELETIDLAFAAKGLEQATRDVKGANFQYGKTVTLPFFHSGVVDLPSQGEKRMKNSRKNHMVFWVFSGRVDVDVSGNNFSIGRGGMWQVPRGNFYSLSNPYTNPARVFFAQGCYMTEKEGLDASE